MPASQTTAPRTMPRHAKSFSAFEFKDTPPKPTVLHV